ncbi:M15 family metallopeptidase [Micromonospora olivasterospora]|uniref:D-alanyl-D-alanine dipeptidase n=1 Tax=Micromonospora olivasterospora TaxID=1880 RepID=A0A562IGL3_MICOL|nr:M15 family metallopeptidase [Micromonospora olivasterospora]TWH69875.1 D-Ala-D-Ala dipeptidase vanX [Micromonospora olivasterospora]
MGQRRGPGRAGRSAALAAVAVVLLTACPGPHRPAPAPPSASVPSRAPANFVVLADVDPTIVTDVRYATAHNFVGRPIAGYAEPLCVLTRPAAEALSRVQRAARAAGHRLKVYDCYRPQRAVADFVAWARQPDEQRMKAEFYPRVAKAKLFEDGYVGTPTAHSRGSTLDLTLVPDPPPSQRPYAPGERLVACTAPAGQRFPDNSVDMGTGFDCFDPLAHTADPRVTGAARGNRELLKRLMTAGGFSNYPREWWHYRYDAEPYPDTYFDFPVARSAL